MRDTSVSPIFSNFTPNPNYWGNESQYMRVYIIQIPDASADDEVYVTQIISNYTKQCNSFYPRMHNNVLQFIVIAYFNDVNKSLIDHVESSTSCNTGWPFVFIYKNSSSTRFTLLTSLLLTDYDRMTPSSYQYYIGNEYMTHSVNDLQMQVGTFSNPQLYTVLDEQNPCLNQKLFLSEIYNTSSVSCASFDNFTTLSMLQSICNTNIYDIVGMNSFSATFPFLAESTFANGIYSSNYVPMFYDKSQYFYEVCPEVCTTVGFTKNECIVYPPSPPPPSPPPPLPFVQVSCDHVYHFQQGWNSFSLIGNTLSNKNISFDNLQNDSYIEVMNTVNNITVIDNKIEAPVFDNSVTNAVFLYSTTETNMSTDCMYNITIRCEQQVQLYTGKNSFGLQGNQAFAIQDLVFEVNPSNGDVIETNDLYKYDFFVYFNTTWYSLTNTPKMLYPYQGYNYYSTMDNTMTLNSC